MDIRLNKFLSEAGVCSRREADKLIAAGKVTVDDVTATVGMRVLPGQKIKVGGKLLKREGEMILLAMNKPVGVVCTTDKRWGDKTVDDVLNYPKRVFSIGRLDKESEGLLLLTNNGDIVNKIMRAGNYHEKEYEVTIHRPVTDEFVSRMAAGGIPVLDQVARPCKVEKIGKYKFRITLTQGLNRQIRRMCQHLGCKVTQLKRLRIMNIHLGDLKPGAYRMITEKEMERLNRLLKNSSSESKYSKGVGRRVDGRKDF